MHCYFSFLRISLCNFIYGMRSAKGKARVKEKRLRKIIKYAREHSDYYRKLYEGIDIEHVNLNELPPVTKVDLMNHFNDWVTDKSINKEELDEFTSHKENIGKSLKTNILCIKPPALPVLL